MALEALHEEQVKPLGLKVSWAKTNKVQQVFGGVLDKTVLQSVHACGEDIEILKNLTQHLGSVVVHNDGGSSQEVTRQIGELAHHGVMDSLNTQSIQCCC